MVDALVTVIGWIGAGLLLVGYGLVAGGRLTGDSVTFHTLNLIGAAALAANSAYHGARPSAALNIVWLGIGGFALVRSKRRKAAPAP